MIMIIIKDFKTKYYKVEKVIFIKFREKLKYDHATKCYPPKPESVRENDVHKISPGFRDTNWSPNRD